ncbi:RsmB/NOP family class I SAM-dependent RNA methyltransferase [Siccirubricoccus phaeus]|uniref:RsmB/NOP family class I SAM-dependent RNA methyltransferase n=1 Tax=Siccirubricoccus phaeus TaxID=2595053 RepID=UPI0011F16247|nr:transcription antitermination factor NusB [Siccirubricoccus phaeus]
MSPSPARRAAAALLDAVLLRHRPLEEALDALPTDGKPHQVRQKGEKRPGAALSPRDKAAGHRIAAAVLRRAGSLDAVLEPFLRREPPPPVRNALRIGAAELLLLATPPHAAVASAVDLVPQPFAGLVNAVLRKVAAAGPAALEGLEAERLDTPPWLWAAWHAAHGPAVRAIAAAHGHEAPLDLSLKPGAAAPEGGEALPGGSWRYPPGTRVTELAGFAEGDWWVQDAAAALPAWLLSVRPGEKVLDLCAAPGGKTAQLAAAGAAVVAVERDPKRAARLRENLARLKLPAEVVEADAAAWDAGGAQFDAVLLDAPCTATGTIRRHPDVPWLKRPRDVPAMAELQRGLLAAAAKRLAPGGRLVFATCSLQAEEGEAHLAELSGLGLALEAARPEEVPGLAAAITPAGALRTRPDMWAERGGMDGFFMLRARGAA